MSALGRWNGPDPLSDSYAHVSTYNYVENNPLLPYDPDGKSWWTKALKAGAKITKTVSREGLGSLKKGATYADAFSGIVSDAETLTDSNAGTGERVVAGLSLASELLPVSVSDVKDGYRAVRRLAAGADEAGDAAQASGRTARNAFDGPVQERTFVVDGDGNAIRVEPSQQLWWITRWPVRTSQECRREPTGTRKNGGHNPATHDDPRALKPHAHVVDSDGNEVTNPDGTPWLPLRGDDEP